MISTIVQDLRYAARNLARRPALVVVAALSLGLGAGFNTVVFSLLNTLLLQPPTASDPNRLVRIEPGNGNLISFPNYRDLPSTNVVSGYAGFTTTRLNLGRDPDAQRIVVMMVTSNLFGLLGVQPARGRGFDPRANAPEQDPRVAVLSDQRWRTTFNADPGVIGRAILLNGEAFTVVGVLGADYRPLTGSVTPDLYVPVSTLIAPDVAERRAPMLTLVARLSGDASPAQAQAAFTESSQSLEAAYPDINKNFSKPALVAPLSGLASLQSRASPQGIYGILAAPFVLVGLVLVIACANVAGLLLARGLSRRREIAIRLSLGAGRRDLIQMLMAESLLLSVVGAALGLVLTVWLTSVLQRVRLPNLSQTINLRVVFDGSLALYLLGLVIVTTLVCGLVPAWQAAGQDLVGALKLGAAGQRVRRRLTLRRALVIGEVAVSSLLLVVSLVFVRSLWIVANTDPGFDVDSGLVGRIELDPGRYNREQARAFAEQLMAHAARLPGVTSVSVANIVPLGGDSSVAYPQADIRADVNGPESNLTNVGPDYFRTMGIPLVRGREFTVADRAGSAPVVIVNEALAHAFFPNGDPIGRRVRLNSNAPYHEIVGVVRNSKYQFLSEPPRPLLYLPYLQSGGRLILHVRVSGAPAALVPAVRSVIGELDHGLLADVGTLRDATSQEFAMRRAGAALLALLGGVGLVLAIVGLYGLVAQTVTERTPEIGLRSALGAQRRSILWIVWRDGLWLTAIGTMVGVGIAGLITSPLSFLLAGVRAADPLGIAAVGGVFMLVSTVACLGPAIRALNVDPVIALRQE